MLSGFPSTNGFETDLGARVRTLRRERGLTLKGLGRLAGLSHPFLSQVERGLARPSVSSVERIAAALDVSVAQLWSPPRQGDAVRVVRESGLPNRTDSMFTTLEGEWDECLDVVRRAVEAVGRHGARVQLVLKADIRPGRTGELHGKLDRLEAALEAAPEAAPPS